MGTTSKGGGRWSRHDIRVTDQSAVRRSVEGTVIGNFMEWYDFSLYSYTATILAQVFFPRSLSGPASIIATFGTLTAAFVMRPLGGFIFGPLGDRIGRKKVLMITIVMMAASTTVTGVLPGYGTIGIWAPIALVSIRVCKGLSTGGEFAGAMTYVDEQASDRRRGMMAGFLPLGTLSGYVAGAALVTGLQMALPSADMMSWGWRIPFWIGAPLGVAAMLMRLRIDESSDYEQGDSDGDDEPSGLGEQFEQTVLKQWCALLLCVGIEMLIGITGYMLTGYLPTYLKSAVHMPDNPALAIVLVVLVILLLAVVFVAMLSDRVGVKPLMWTGCGGLIVAAVPAFLLMRSGGSYLVKFLGVLLIGLPYLCFTSVEPRTLPSLFPTRVRYGATSIGFNVTVSGFGGPTPLIAESLMSVTGSSLAPAYLLIVAGAIGAVTLFFAPEVAGKRMPGEGPSVEDQDEALRLEGKTRDSRPAPR
jgi:MFS transporter, MHS family, proline/betaine transporter